MNHAGVAAASAMLAGLTVAFAPLPPDWAVQLARPAKVGHAAAQGVSRSPQDASRGPRHPVVGTNRRAVTNFQLPFPCGQAWKGNSSGSSAHRSWEIDFNRGSGSADRGAPVVAAAAGTVATSAHQGSANGFGNLVKIDHGGGWASYYAHLSVRSVRAGQRVVQGQKIGTVGNTSKPGNNISPHLHYEVRQGGRYPSNIRKAVFNGATFGYPVQTVTSRNCAHSGPDPDRSTPQEVCGSGFSVIDSAPLGSSGTAYLLYNSATGANCVTTIKSASVGTPTPTSAYLEVQGGTRVTDTGNFGYYAGPVRAAAPGKCVKWGGKAGTSTYDSPFEHCG